MCKEDSIMSEKITFVPLTDLNRGKASKIIKEMNKLKQSVYIVKNNKPEAVMISMDEYDDYRDYLFYKEVNNRLQTYEANPSLTYSREEIMKENGINEGDISNTEDIKFDYE